MAAEPAILSAAGAEATPAADPPAHLAAGAFDPAAGGVASPSPASSEEPVRALSPDVTPVATPVPSESLPGAGTPAVPSVAPAAPVIAPPATRPAVAEDVNGDGVVGCIDLGLMLDQWGRRGAGLSADLNLDQHVNSLDLSILSSNFTGDGTSSPGNADGTGKCG